MATQQDQQTATSTTSLNGAQLAAAAAYYQAQLLFLANPAAFYSGQTAGSGEVASIAGMDGGAVAEYYRQLAACNDRTPTTSDIEDSGTPVASDGEEEKDRNETFAAGKRKECTDQSKLVKSKIEVNDRGEKEKSRVRRSRKHVRPSPKTAHPAVSSSKGHTTINKRASGCESSSGQDEALNLTTATRSSYNQTVKGNSVNGDCPLNQNTGDRGNDRVAESSGGGVSSAHDAKVSSQHDNRSSVGENQQLKRPRGDKKKDAVELAREREICQRLPSTSWPLSTSGPGLMRSQRSRSPRNDKENVRRFSPPTRERRRPRERVEEKRLKSSEKSSRRSDMERPSASDGLSRQTDNRKRKRSHTPLLTGSQQEVKHARTGSDVKESPLRCVSPPLIVFSGCLESPFELSPNFDDITAPPTPNADEILPYCADVELCENSAVMVYDAGGCGQQGMLDISCPPTPTSEAQEPEDTIAAGGEMSRVMDETDSRVCKNEPRAKPRCISLCKEVSPVIEAVARGYSLEEEEEGEANSEASKPVELHVPECSDVKQSSDLKQGGGELKEDSDLEEGEVMDSDCDEERENQMSLTVTNDKSDVITCRGKRVVKSDQSLKAVSRVGNERSYNRVSSSGTVRHQTTRHSPRRPRHEPLSDWRNKRSPQSLKNRSTELFCHDDHVIRKHRHSDRHSHYHSFKHRRSNLL